MFFKKKKSPQINSIKSYFLEKELIINQEEIDETWFDKNFNKIKHDAVISALGKFKRSKEINKNAYHMPILHFIIKHNNITFKEALFIQRLFVLLIKEALGPNYKRVNNDFFIINIPISLPYIYYFKSQAIIYIGLLVNYLTPENLNMPDFTINHFAINIMQNYVQEVRNLNKILNH